jgi:hypothetical protein
MSEVEGYVTAYIKNSKKFESLVKEFEKGNSIHIGENRFDVFSARFDRVVDIHIYSNEACDLNSLDKYLLEKYDLEILVSALSHKSYVNGQSVNSKKAYKKLGEVDHNIDFYLQIELSNLDKAFALLRDDKVSLEDEFMGIPNYERCFFEENSNLMSFAVDRGFHNHYCLYDKNFIKPDTDGGTHVLHRIAKCGDINLIRKALCLGANPNGKNGDKRTLLHEVGYLSFSGQFNIFPIELIQLLAEYGADFNGKDWEGKTPLFTLLDEACDDVLEDDNYKLLAKCVSLFIENGAEIEGFDSTGAGLLLYYNHIPDILNILKSKNSKLTPHSKDFNFEDYICAKHYIYDRENKVVDIYKHYISDGFPELLFTQEVVEKINFLTPDQLSKLLVLVVESDHALKIITEWNKHKIPIFSEYDKYFDRATYEDHKGFDTIKIAEHLNKDDVVNFLSCANYRSINYRSKMIDGSHYYFNEAD